MSKDEIKILASQLHFECSEEELNDIQKEFENLEAQLALFAQIETEDVEEMIYPFDVETSFLRNDEEVVAMERDLLLSNAHEVKEGHVVVPRVIKDGN